MTQTFRDRVIATGLPLDQIIVIGSGILDTLGIRTTDDIDMAVAKELFETLQQDGSWQQKTAQWGDTYLQKGDCEVWRGWDMDGSGHPTYDDLLGDTTVIDDVRYVSLGYLLQWKKEKHRPKDLADITRIQEYIHERQ